MLNSKLTEQRDISREERQHLEGKILDLQDELDRAYENSLPPRDNTGQFYDVDNSQDPQPHPQQTTYSHLAFNKRDPDADLNPKRNVISPKRNFTITERVLHYRQKHLNQQDNGSGNNSPRSHLFQSSASQPNPIYGNRNNIVNNVEPPRRSTSDVNHNSVNHNSSYQPRMKYTRSQGSRDPR
eukprot:UN24939